MGNTRIFLTFCLFFHLFSHSPLSGQIIFKQLPGYQIKTSDSLFFDITSTRKIIPLNGNWTVYPDDDEKQKAVTVIVPSIFSGEGELIFEKEFSLSPAVISNNKMKIVFLGLNYTADISVNNVIIFRHSGGEYPFQLDLPKDILTADKPNILKVKLTYFLDAQNTIPVKQRFLFPQNFGGIFRDVYLHLTPDISISDIEIQNSFTPGKNTGVINLFARIDNKEFNADSLELKFKAILVSPFDGSNPVTLEEGPFLLTHNKERSVNKIFNLTAPVLWSPSSPYLYHLHLELLRGDEVIDHTIQEVGLYSLEVNKDSLLLNGSGFDFHGVTYIPSNTVYGNLMNYNDMEKDIKIIKNAGFNSIRFAKSVPHPYHLKLCSSYGLLALIEMPANAIPGNLIEDINFIERSRNYLTAFIKPYKKYTSLAAIGLGSSIPPASEAHLNILPGLAAIIKKNSGLLTYASFSGFNISEVEGVDLYGVEIFNKSINQSLTEFETLRNQLGSGRVFISSATYVVNSGSSDGYLNEHSFEAQAKFFEDLLDFSADYPSAGYFLNTMFDYRGDFSSLAAGYNGNGVYYIGIADENRGTERISYNVINSRLNNLEKVTIPIGSRKDNAPMIFIIFGLVTALMIGVLVNSGRKFREDASRALTRPYNFYADVRDQRIMSGLHTTFLAVVVSAVSSLLLSNLLHYLKDKLVFEKFLLAFGSPGLMKMISYLAWSPLFSLLWLFIASLLFLILLTLIIKIASFFVRNRVFISSVYYSVTWSFLPLILLIPVGIVLFRILEAETLNIYLYAALLLFSLWIFYRLMKGIYVIFDVNAGSVYFYSLLVIFVVVGGFLLYYEINNSVFDYLKLTINEYNAGSR